MARSPWASKTWVKFKDSQIPEGKAFFSLPALLHWATHAYTNSCSREGLQFSLWSLMPPQCIWRALPESWIKQNNRRQHVKRPYAGPRLYLQHQFCIMFPVGMQPCMNLNLKEQKSRIFFTILKIVPVVSMYLWLWNSILRTPNVYNVLYFQYS